MTQYLKKELGKNLSPKEVASFFQLDVRTVRKYYVELGGLKLGRIIMFFENRIVQALERGVNHAIQTREKMGCRSNAPGDETIEEVPEQERSSEVGVRTKTSQLKRLVKADPHGIFHSGVGQ